MSGFSLTSGLAFFQKFYNNLICRQPANAVQIFRSEPSGSLMLFQYEIPRSHRGGKTIHAEMKLRIIVFYRCQLFSYGDSGIKFFEDFAAERLFRRFSSFDFPSGKFPIILPVPVPTLGSKDFFPVADDSSDYLYCFHQLSFIFLSSACTVSIIDETGISVKGIPRLAVGFLLNFCNLKNIYAIYT